VAASKPLLTRSGRLVHSYIPEVPFAKMNVCCWHIASFRCAAKLGRYWRHSGHCSALAHIANSGIFPAQSLKQGTKCRISTTRAAQICWNAAGEPFQPPLPIWAHQRPILGLQVRY
jgi:hypothetical protein